MRIPKKKQIAARRQLVLELRAQGLSQAEIASRLPTVVDQKTVSNDLKFIRAESLKNISRKREEVAFEFELALSNLYQLRKKAWAQFTRAETAKPKQDEEIQLRLYPIIESINANIMALLSTSDIIEQDILESVNGQIHEIELGPDSIAHEQDRRHAN